MARGAEWGRVKGGGVRAGCPGGGFTILELLVAAAVLAVILVFLLGTISQTTRIWRQSSDTIESYQSAREAFDLITRRLAEATLNTYWAYELEEIGGEQFPVRYRRESDLHFLAGPGLAGLSHAVFFQAPEGATENAMLYGGMNQLLNDSGFYLTHGPDTPWRPESLAGFNPAPRYRLLQLTVPTEHSGPFRRDRPRDWHAAHTDTAAAAFARRNVPIGENIIAVVFHPRRAPLDEEVNGPLPGGFAYDSRAGATSSPQPVTANQLPPLLDVVMVAIDERSAVRLAEQYPSEEPPVIREALRGRLTEPALLERDLEELEVELAAAGIKHRVFRATVPVHASKWSESRPQ